MYKFFRILLMILSIISFTFVVGCAKEDDYIEGNDPSDYGYYDENGDLVPYDEYVEPEIASFSRSKEFEKLLKKNKIPDYRVDLEGFAKKAFIGNRESMGENFLYRYIEDIGNQMRYQNIRFDVDPTRVIIFRSDQNFEKSPLMQYVIIEQYNSIFEFSDEEKASTIYPYLEPNNIEVKGVSSDWMARTPLKFYGYAFYEKKKGKEKLISSDILCRMHIDYEQNPTNKSECIEFYYDNMTNDLYTAFVKVLNKIFTKYIDWTYNGVKP